MYDLKKLEDEEIVLISDESVLKVDNEERYISTILTKKRVLISFDILLWICYDEYGWRNSIQ